MWFHLSRKCFGSFKPLCLFVAERGLLLFGVGLRPGCSCWKACVDSLLLVAVLIGSGLCFGIQIGSGKRCVDVHLCCFCGPMLHAFYSRARTWSFAQHEVTE